MNRYGRYHIERETGEDYREQILGWVRSKRDHSAKEYAGYRRALPALYSIYRGDMRHRAKHHRNNINVPLTYSVLQAITARSMDTHYGEYPYITMLGAGSEDAAVARRQEALIYAQMQDMSIVRKSYDLFLGAALYGTACAESGWAKKMGQRWVVDVNQLPLSGRTVRRGRVVEVPEFDGPELFPIDLLDCYPQPGHREVDEMLWFIFEKWLDFDQVRDLAQPHPDTGEPFFDPREVRRMEEEGGGATSAESMYKELRWTKYMFSPMEEALRSEPGGRPVKITEYRGVLPSELVKDGMRQRRIVIANDRYLLRNAPNEDYCAHKGIFAYSPTPDLHHFFAIGKGELAAKIQIAANRFTNQQLDALDAYIYPSFLYNELSGFDPEGQYLVPGSMKGVQGPVGPEILYAIQPDLRGIEFGTAKTQELWRWVQQATGVADDLVLGLGSNRPETARSVLARQEAVGSRLLMEARMFEVQFLEKLANKMMVDNQQYLDTPRAIYMLGNNAIIDPVTKQPIVSRQEITDYDLVNRYIAQAYGSVRRVTRGQMQQNQLLMLQAVSANPVVAGAINWIAFFRDMFRRFEFTNVDELLVSQDQYQQVLSMAMQGQGTPAEQLIPGASEIMGNGSLPPEMAQPALAGLAGAFPT